VATNSHHPAPIPRTRFCCCTTAIWRSPADDELIIVRYNGRPPHELDTGSYTLTLRVEDKNDPSVGHQTSRAVVLT
jgi:hypothetical protein